MAFYTALDPAELQALLARYGIPASAACDGASDGIENSTYFLAAGEQQWVLTVFEEIGSEELPFFVRLMDWLFARQLPVAHALADSQGVALHTLSGKPALLFPRLPGRHPRQTSIRQCEAIGDFLGRMHTVTCHYPEQRDNPRGTAWMEQAALRLAGHLDVEGQALLEGQLANARQLRASSLPQGLIHADLFHDNALFDGDQLCGVIDFYVACTDLLALDLAIVINDWCALPSGGVDPDKAQAIRQAYERQRPLVALEREHWQAILQLAACRFWLSRLLAEKVPSRSGVSHPHKPSVEYRLRLEHHLNEINS